MKRFLCLVAGLVVSASMLFVPSTQVSAIDMDRNRIIDDWVFDNSNSMNAVQINTFLNSYPHSCISPNSGFEAIKPTGYNPSQGFLYGGFVTAGEVIAAAATAYGINPQVLLVTLEKEQNLVQGRDSFSTYCMASSDRKYSAAAGYGCPDSGGSYSYSGVSLYRRDGVERTSIPSTCVNSLAKVGFSQQIIRAAWLLKFGEQRSKGNTSWAVITGSWDNSDDPQSCYGGPMTAGWHRVCPNGATVYYDGYRTIDGTPVLMGTGATAALYWYTPHFHGNEVFFDKFVEWFGLPYANDTNVPHPNGTLVSDGIRVFMIENNTRKHVTYASFLSHNWRWSDVKPASTGDKDLPEGDAYQRLAPGTIFTQGDGFVYVVDWFGGVLKKQWLSSDAFVALGYSWSEIMRIGPGEAPAVTEAGLYTRNRHPAGDLVSVNGWIYQMQESSRRHVQNPVVFDSHRLRWDRVRTPTADDLAVPTGPALETRQGTMFLSGGGIFVIDYDGSGSLKRPVGPWECYSNRLHYSSSDWYNVPTGYLPSRTGTLFTC